jgi:hypothetical protein
MAAEDGQPAAGTQSPPPIFTQEQQQWIEQLISSRTQGQAGTSTGETTVSEIDGTAGGTASGRAGGIPIPTLPLPSGSTAPNPGNLVTTPVLGTTPHPTALSGIPTFSLGGPNASVPAAAASLVPPAPAPATNPAILPTAAPVNAFHLPSGSVPQKLIKKILDLEFVDMSELLPDTWRLQDEEESKCCHQPRRAPRRGPITDILRWVECYASFVAILTTRYPDKGPELMAYLRTIVHAQRTFAGEG